MHGGDKVKWLKRKLREWLGVDQDVLTLKTHIDNLYELNKDLVSIDVDVHFKNPHMILIYTRLNGGQLRHVEADFKDIKELTNFVRDLKRRFHTTRGIYDSPPHLKQYFK